jgi:hypothetical protein
MTTITTIDEQTFRAAVADAVLAPSMYNEQPWRFSLVGGVIEVRIDRRRGLPAADPTGWAARVACGAAVANIRLRLAVAGLEPVVRVHPSAAEPDLVATVGVGGSHAPSPSERALCAAIPRRHSNRRPFADAPVPAKARARMQDVVGGAGGWLVLVDDRAGVARIAEIIAHADATLRSSREYVAEMRAWTGRDAADTVGIPTHSAGVAPATQDLLAMRDYGGPQRPPGRDFETDPLLAVLGTIGGHPDDDVAAGIMLQMVLLIATDERLATSMLSQPIEVPSSRDEVAGAVRRRGVAQMIIRAGYGQPTTASPRRPIEDVIDVVPE